MSANDRQVGGDHYAVGKDLQHWDLMEDHQVPYLEGNATKYMSRWHKKNGIQDIEKAIHYLEKLTEGMKARWSRKQPSFGVPLSKIERLCQQQGCSSRTTQAMMLVLKRNRSTTDLEQAKALMAEELAEVRKRLASLPAGPEGVGMKEPFGFDPALDVA